VRRAAVVVTWEGGEATARCVASLLAQDLAPDEVVVVDNASGDDERARLTAMAVGDARVQLLLLPDNRQFAGGLNAGAAAALARGAERLLFLNNDTVVDADALRLLDAALDATPAAGIAGPRVLDLATGDELSAGERHDMTLLCVPRTLLRYRRPPTAPYAVSGVMGCALLVTRACFTAVGGFSEELQVYYEDVDFCVAARAYGFGAVVEPRAVVRHDGLRGFATGMTPWAAYLKARNPWILMRRRGGAAAWIAFLPVYGALVATSAIAYGLRGRGDVTRALARGAIAGVRAAAGGGVVPIGAPRES
jgi:hypothetical protein